MTYHSMPFTQRYASLGDRAEAAFDRVHPQSHRLGLNRPPFWMGGMTAAMRYTPDRMTRLAFHECMGIGKDQTLKLKLEKIEALTVWTHVGPVELFVYDSKNDRYWEAPLDEWVARTHEFGASDTFHDGKAYVALKATHFPSTPTQVPHDDLLADAA